MRRTVAVDLDGSRAAISLRPAPVCEPPFDDQPGRSTGAGTHQSPFDDQPGRSTGAGTHQLSLDWSPSRPRSSAPPHRPPAPPRRSVVAGASHDAKLAVHRFVRLCVEVLNGHRPPAHLRHVSQPAEAAAVVNQALSAARRVADLRRAGHPQARRPPRRPSPVAVVSLRLCEPRPGAVEAAVALVTGERTWALALRMELHQEAWTATTLRLI